MERLQAGGTFRSYLDVYTDSDGMRNVRKYGHEVWTRRFAALVKPTYQIAEYLSDCDAAFDGLPPDAKAALNRAIAHFESTGEWSGLPKIDIASIIADRETEQANIWVRENIAKFEGWANEQPGNSVNWSMLAPLYDKIGRHKDAETALERSAALDRAKFPDQEGRNWSTQMQLGKLYLAAISFSFRGRGVHVWGGNVSNVTPDSLGYSVDQLREMARKRIEDGRSHALAAGVDESDNWLRQAALAKKAIDDPTPTTFEDFDNFDLG